MKTIFMGTPDFSCCIADALSENGFDIIAVVTQPDKESGRGKKLKPSPVKVWASKRNIPVYQPEKVKTDEFISIIKEINPELILTAAFGQIIPKEVLEIPEFGCVNVHASLLPMYRGASPIQQSLFHGDRVTGVTLQYMAEKMDEGDIILQKELQILPEDNTGTLFEKLAQLGKFCISEYKKMLYSGKPSGIPQDNSLASYCKKIAKEEGNINWENDAEAIQNTIRAMSPSPGAFSFLNDKRIKIITAYSVDDDTEAAPGKIINAYKTAITVKCGKNALKITALQPEGKSVQQVRDFINGNKLTAESAFERKLQ